MRSKVTLIALMIQLLLSGCIKWIEKDDDDEATTASLAGIYSGSGGWIGHITEWGGITLITDSGEMVALLSDGTYMRGTLYRNGKNLYGNTSLWTGQPIWSAGNIVGRVDGHGVLLGDLMINNRRAIPFVFESMEHLYQRQHGLHPLEGIWTNLGTHHRTTWVIDPGGVITGSDSQGCFFHGAISHPLRERNLYRVSVRASNCQPSPGISLEDARDGLHTGLAFYLPDGTSDRGEELVVLIDNGKTPIGFAFSR